MYIGLRETKQYDDGRTVSSFIEFDEKFINGKIDYFEKDDLMARKNLLKCDDDQRDDFASKVDNTNGVTIDGFEFMRCIPSDTFNLFNEPGTPNISSI